LVGGRNGAAARLGVPRTTLIYKLKRLGILSTVGPNLRRSSSSDLSAEWNFARGCQGVDTLTVPPHRHVVTQLYVTFAGPTFSS
jgi:hypothetical protein